MNNLIESSASSIKKLMQENNVSPSYSISLMTFDTSLPGHLTDMAWARELMDIAGPREVYLQDCPGLLMFSMPKSDDILEYPLGLMGGLESLVDYDYWINAILYYWDNANE